MLLFGSFLHASMLPLLLLLTHSTRLVRHQSCARTRLFASGSGSYVPDLISSTRSNTVKKIQALLTRRRKRTETGQVVVEGPRMIMDLWNSAETKPLVRQIVVDQAKWETYNADQFLTPSDVHESDGHVMVLAATSQVLQCCTDTVNNQGIIAVCDIPKYDLSSSSSSPSDGPRPLLFLVLDAVSDPGNAGALLRSAVAAGSAAAFLLPNCCDPWNPKALRSAAGAAFRLPLIEASSWDDCEARLRGLGCRRIYAATVREGDDDGNDFKGDGSDRTGGISHYEVDWAASTDQGPSALVIGSEGNGLTPPLRLALERGQVQAVHVPMQPGIESLNAAVCGSVILFEYCRQARQREQRQS